MIAYVNCMIMRDFSLTRYLYKIEIGHTSIFTSN